MGRIVGAWGLHGELRVEPLTDFPARLTAGSILYLEGQPACIQRSRGVRDGFQVKLDIVNDRARAKSLRGQFLTVPSDQLNPLPQDSYYHFHIIDMEVWSEEGGYLGQVKGILATGSNDVYVVGDEGGKELLLPALDSVILKVNLLDNKMTVRLPEGLM